MNEAALIILGHQLLFQGAFFVKNITLKHRLGAPVRGDNREARRAIYFFTLFILLALVLALGQTPFGRWNLVPDEVAEGLCLLLLLGNMGLGLASLWNLGESWRVGILDDQATELVKTGIYRFTRNPYFVAYILMFLAYTVLLQNLLLLALSLAGTCLIHAMILKEEAYLKTTHGQAYRDYQRRTPRYLLV